MFYNRGGVNKNLLNRIATLEEEVSQLKRQKAGKTTYGLAKISDLTDVTTEDGLVLGTKEKNATIPGTIAHNIEAAKDSLSSQILDIGSTVYSRSNTQSATFTEGYKDVELCRLSNLQPGFYLVYTHTWVSHYQFAVASDLFLNGTLLCATVFPGGVDNRFWCRIVGVSSCQINAASDALHVNASVGLPAGQSVPGSCMITAIRLKK